MEYKENMLMLNKKLKTIDHNNSIFYIMIKDTHSCMATIKLLDNFYDNIKINNNYDCNVIFYSYDNECHIYNYKVIDCNYKITEFIISIGINVNDNDNDNEYGYILNIHRLSGDPFIIINILDNLKILLKNNDIDIKINNSDDLLDDLSDDLSDDLNNIDDFPNNLDEFKLGILKLENDPEIINIWIDNLKNINFAIDTLNLLLNNYNINYENNFKIINNALLSNEGKDIIKLLTDKFLDKNDFNYVLKYSIYQLLYKYFDYNKLYDEYKYFINKNLECIKYRNNKYLLNDNITIIFDKLKGIN